MQQDLPNTHGLIVGEARPRQTAYLYELKNKIANYGLGSAITFLGNRSDLREIMSISNIVLSLSSKPESFGRVILEALSLGIPVVAYNHGGATEILDRLFPAGQVSPSSVDETVQKIKLFNQHPPKINSNNPFTLDNMLNKTLTLYEKLVASS